MSLSLACFLSRVYSAMANTAIQTFTTFPLLVQPNPLIVSLHSSFLNFVPHSLLISGSLRSPTPNFSPIFITLFAKTSNMVYATLASIPSLSNPYTFPELPKVNSFASLKLVNKNEEEHSIQSARCRCSPRSDVNCMNKLKVQNPGFSASCLTVSAIVFEAETSGDVVADKLPRLVSEFKSLLEPVDRVRRLLDYAALLPPLEESARVPENRVKGCGTQVWLVSEMDECGRMRFRADSDSEISRGFCSCLIWILDGAEPEEVLMVETEDLVDMSVGLYGKAQSRVNTWHNVLLSMQTATKALTLDMERKPPLETLPSLIVNDTG